MRGNRIAMTIILRPEQELLIQEAIDSGLAHSADEALDQAFDMLRHNLPSAGSAAESTAVVARRLANFGQYHGLSLGGITIKELRHESRP